jgi:biopolymer transport protein ExbD
MVDVKMQGAGLDQQVELNSRPMTMVELSTTSRSARAAPDKTVFIKAPKDKQYGDIVSVIDAVRERRTAHRLQIDYLQ